MDAAATYQAGHAAAQARVRHHESRIHALSLARLAVAIVALSLVVGVVWWHLPPVAMGGVAGLVVAFVVLVVVHARVFDARDRARASLRFHERGLARLDGTWRAFPGTGADYASVNHPFADNLDIFGPASVFQLVDATETPFGATRSPACSRSGRCLTGARPPSRGRRTSREQEAVRELAACVAWREQLSVEGAVLRAEAPESCAVLRWAEGASPLARFRRSSCWPRASCP